MRGKGLSSEPRVVHASRSMLGEGPAWDGDRNQLLWVDILGEPGGSGGVVRLAEFDGDHLTVTAEYAVGEHVGVAVPALGGGWLLAAGKGFAHLAETGTVTTLAAPEAANPVGTRMNDGACDPQGRFWAGSLAYDETPGAGSLYRLDHDGRVTVVLRGLTIPNGLGWSPDGQTMYVTDSAPGTVTAYRFEAETGEISEPRPLISLSAEAGVPDGLSVDVDGNLWIAVWGGAEVRRYAPDGSLSATIAMPVSQPSSCCFGGPDRDVLFITSARVGLSEADLAAEPAAGAVFAMRTDTAGAPVRRYAGRTAPSS